jgi:hypothetical protein
MNNQPLSMEAIFYKDLKHKLQLEYQLNDDDPVLLDTLEGATNLREHLAGLVRQIQDDECSIDGLQKRINQMQARKSRLIARAEKFRSWVAETMMEVGVKKLFEPDLTVSLRTGQQPLVFTVSPDFMTPFTEKTTSYSWDRKALRGALERGDPKALEVAKFGNSQPIITINTR